MVLESGSAALSGGMSAEAVVRVSSANARAVDEEGSNDDGDDDDSEDAEETFNVHVVDALEEEEA